MCCAFKCPDYTNSFHIGDKFILCFCVTFSHCQSAWRLRVRSGRHKFSFHASMINAWNMLKLIYALGAIYFCWQCHVPPNYAGGKKLKEKTRRNKTKLFMYDKKCHSRSMAVTYMIKISIHIACSLVLCIRVDSIPWFVFAWLQSHHRIIFSSLASSINKNTLRTLINASKCGVRRTTYRSICRLNRWIGEWNSMPWRMFYLPDFCLFSATNVAGLINAVSSAAKFN